MIEQREHAPPTISAKVAYWRFRVHELDQTVHALREEALTSEHSEPHATFWRSFGRGNRRSRKKLLAAQAGDQDSSR